MSIANRFKAPNILILTEFDNDFNSIKNFIRSILGYNSYTIYNVKLTQLKAIPEIWIDNCHLLVTIEKSNNLNDVYEDQYQYMKKYLQTGGKILSVPSWLDNKKYKIEVFQEKKIFVYEGNFEFELQYERENLKKQNSAWNSYIYSYNDQHWISKICPNPKDIEKSNSAENKSAEILVQEIFQSLLTKGLNLKLNEKHELKPHAYYILSKSNLLQSPTIIESFLKDYIDKESGICVPNDNFQINFNKIDYFKNLLTKKLGHTILYSDIANSTMNAISLLPNGMNNVVAIAKQQIQGVGNNKNEWLSPIGCAMFTVFINLNSNNFPTSRLCLLQYAAAISCIEAVVQEEGYQNVPLKIKWPNDIFYKNDAKIGGILVKSSIMSDNLTVQIGIGVNISNQYPTFCLNSILEELHLEKWTCEKFISKCLNRLEYHVDKLRYELNVDAFTKKYQDYWLHKEQNVHVEHWNEDVQVEGIDDYGYLKVRRKDGQLHTLQPDGNRFDMMRNLIVFK